MASSPHSASAFFIDVIRFAFIALIIVVPFRIFIAQPFIVNGQSMAPTFASGDYLIIDQISYRFNEPERGEVIVFHYPKQPSKFFIKRIIGLPGETVEISDGTVTLYNTEHPEGFQLNEPYLTYHSSHSLRVTLENDEYFVMGDNRPASSDSRSWGPLERDLIQGRPVARVLPISTADILPGANYE